MLVLSRKNRESVVIGRPDGTRQLLRVTVIDASAGKVRLGFEAEADVAVHREEVWERICAETQAPIPKQVAERSKYRVPYMD